MDIENTWICNICGHKNQNDEVVCEQCGALSIESSYDAISYEDNS